MRTGRWIAFYRSFQKLSSQGGELLWDSFVTALRTRGLWGWWGLRQNVRRYETVSRVDTTCSSLWQGPTLSYRSFCPRQTKELVDLVGRWRQFIARDTES